MNYLPSKNFVRKVIAIALALLIIFGLYKTIEALIKGFSKARKNSELKEVLVKDLVEQDSNSNGIPDWEESLWGLDPTKNGKKNEEIISAKKSELEQTTDEELTPNDLLARELLVLLVTLRETGNLNENSMQSIYQSIEEKIEAEEFEDIYTKKMVSTVTTKTESIQDYYIDLKMINDSYADVGLGDELTFVAQGIQNEDQQALELTQDIAKAYSTFGKDLMKINVPSSLVNNHIEMANNYEKTGLSVQKMQSLLDDQITSVNSILSYKKYNDSLIENWEVIETFFNKNGILK
ncbi:MAG: hypothetical protein U9R00_03660 [Patescibacteria group bacterium]|nr:hypothetical protein [Patescibacteria group bacterium]